MSDFRVSFFKLEYEKDAKGTPKKTGKADYIGSVVVDDNISNEYTLMSKAFRIAPPNCLSADKVVVEKL